MFCYVGEDILRFDTARPEIRIPSPNAELLGLRPVFAVGSLAKRAAKVKLLNEGPFRLINSQNGPDVKLTSTDDGAGLALGGDSGYVQILSRGANPPFIKIVNKDGREQTLKP